MAYEGDGRLVIDYPANASAPQHRCGHFLIRSERELNNGNADLELEPFLARYRRSLRLRHRTQASEVRPGHAAAVSERFERAKGQLRQYLDDEGLRKREPSVRHVGLALVFRGWERVVIDAVGGTPARLDRL